MLDRSFGRRGGMVALPLAAALALSVVVGGGLAVSGELVLAQSEPVRASKAGSGQERSREGSREISREARTPTQEEPGIVASSGSEQRVFRS